MKDEQALEKLRLPRVELLLYSAGLPLFTPNFTRDSILASYLLQDPVMLRDQLIYSAVHQGRHPNALTGEEYGKIHHELPGAIMRGRSTLFNACDTTSLFLLGHQWYREMCGDKGLGISWRSALSAAAQYIIAHVQDGLFIEGPSFANAESFALRVTYWKDSVVAGRDGGEPAYPITYSLAHYQARNALRAAAALLEDSALDKKASEMTEAGRALFSAEHGYFFLGRDSLGPITAITSDALHLLFYIDPGEFEPEVIARDISATTSLETAIGYRTMEKCSAAGLENSYHASTVWPFEQAFIHIGALRHGVEAVAQIAERIIPFLDTQPEYFRVGNGEPKKAGCDPQLWTIAAKSYFARNT